MVPDPKLVLSMSKVISGSEIRDEVTIAGEEALLLGNVGESREDETLSAEGTEMVVVLASAPENGPVWDTSSGSPFRTVDISEVEAPQVSAESVTVERTVVGVSVLGVSCGAEPGGPVWIWMVVSVGSTMMMVAPRGMSGDGPDPDGPTVDSVLEEVASVPSASDGVPVGSPGRTGIVSLFPLVIGDVTVSLMLLG